MAANNRFIELVQLFLLTSIIAFLSNKAFAQSWTSLSNMNRVRFESSAVQYNDDIYVFNGFGQSIRIEPTVEKFDAGSKTWSTVGGTSVVFGNAVTHNGIIRNGNEAWLIGGRKGSHPGQVSNQVWKYNLSSGSWTSGPSLPQPVAAGGGALVNNKIHWFGGLDPQANCDTGNHFVYDLGQPSAGWQNITGYAAMPSPRNHFATAVLNGWIYAIGGQYGHDSCPGKFGQDTNLVHAFNPQTNQWVQKASLPNVQSHMEPSTFVYHGAIYVIGGEQNGNKIYRYDATQNDWDTVGTLPGNLVAPVARVIDDKLIVASGGAPNAFAPTAKTYATDIAPLILPGTEAPPEDTDDDHDENTNNMSSELANGESLVSIEAEYFDNSSTTSTHAWQTTGLANSSNNAAVVTTPDSGVLRVDDNDSPGLGYLAIFDRTGVWYVWLRGWGNTNSFGEGSSDSVHAGLNGQLSDSADKIDYFPAGWNWSNSTRDGARATINVQSAGINTFNLWMREDGLAVDKIILTTDANYRPTGEGPESTDGTSHGDSDGTSDENNHDTDDTEVATELECNGKAVTVQLSIGQLPTSGADVILGTSGNDVIDGLGGNDTICALAGNDTINSGPGNDWVDGGVGVDAINGGSGNDTIFTGPGATAGSGVFVSGGTGDDTIHGGADADDIRGSNGADRIYGNNGNDIINGGSGRDVINGGDGNDVIKGQGSRDIINGDDGDDIIHGGNEKDTINGGNGNDVIAGGPGDDVLRGDSGADSLGGGSGDDTLVGGPSGGDTCNGQSGSDSAAASCETISGTPQN
jgi:Ca2+-binding RTX toxin-like protein